jgi:sugar phosphate isomerase/epimerase
MRIAIQEQALPGRSIGEKFEQALALGIQGIEFGARDLGAKIPAIVEAMERTGVQVAAVHHGHQTSILEPSPDLRERALAELRQSIMDAADVGASGVVFVPAFSDTRAPDFTPWLTPAGLMAEFLNEHLRTLEDYANAMGVDLYIEPVNRYETHFIQRLEQAAQVAQRRNHARVRLSANLFHMALEETDVASALQAHADLIGIAHLADTNRRLPGQGMMNFSAVAAGLRMLPETTWRVLEGRETDASSGGGIAESLAYLEAAGVL